MTDLLLSLSENPLARRILGSAKLPIPMPEKLDRLVGPGAERFLEGKAVMVGGVSDLSGTIARAIVRAGATPHVSSEKLAQVFRGPCEAFGRPLRLAPSLNAGSGPRLHAVVLDATGIQSPQDLRQLYDFFHPRLRFLGSSGRAIILGRPADEAQQAGQAAARAGVDGFNRSLCKEIGRKGATSNLILVEQRAEERVSAPLRFFLSAASAFVDGQLLRISSGATWDGDDPWTEPLRGKVALVTGAARGIGAATAQVLSAEGAHVVCLDRPDDDVLLSQTAKRARGSILLADVAEPEAPAQIADELARHHGGVDIVVHNAGVTRDRTLARMDEGRWDMTLDVNLSAVLRITEALVQKGLRDHGRIVNLSSIAGLAGNMGQTNYAASKAGVVGFTRFLARELAGRGITVNAVAPGFIDTRMTAAIPLMVREVGRRLSALGQGGLPEDVARTIAFLSTPGAAGVTGSVLRVCGGALIGA